MGKRKSRRKNTRKMRRAKKRNKKTKKIRKNKERCSPKKSQILDYTCYSKDSLFKIKNYGILNIHLILLKVIIQKIWEFFITFWVKHVKRSLVG